METRAPADVATGVADGLNALLAAGSKTKYKLGVLQALEPPNAPASTSPLPRSLAWVKQVHPKIHAALLQPARGLSW